MEETYEIEELAIVGCHLRTAHRRSKKDVKKVISLVKVGSLMMMGRSPICLRPSLFGHLRRTPDLESFDWSTAGGGAPVSC